MWAPRRAGLGAGWGRALIVGSVAGALAGTPSIGRDAGVAPRRRSALVRRRLAGLPAVVDRDVPAQPRALEARRDGLAPVAEGGERAAAASRSGNVQNAWTTRILKPVTAEERALAAAPRAVLGGLRVVQARRRRRGRSRGRRAGARRAGAARSASARSAGVTPRNPVHRRHDGVEAGVGGAGSPGRSPVAARRDDQRTDADRRAGGRARPCRERRRPRRRARRAARGRRARGRSSPRRP